MASGVAKLPDRNEREKDEDERRDEETEPIWVKGDQQWELTWPIWHMLPRDERKAIANRYGYKTIGDFEEFMILRKTVGVSEEQKPYENAKIYPEMESKPKAKRKSQEIVNPAPKSCKSDGDKESEKEEDEEELGAIEHHEKVETDIAEEREDLSPEEIVERAGFLLTLPDELIRNMFEWLPVDSFATMAMVSPHWKYLTRTESVYKRLCERIYLHQSARRILHVKRFGGSYRNMLRHRPRVRTGMYVLKFSKVKPIQRDMWTEIPIGAILETVYYRYLYFQEDGTLLYALTPSPPHDMIPRMKRMNITKQPERAVVWGSFMVQGKHVTVTAQQEWQTVRLELSIQPESLWGRFGALTFDRHLTSASGDFDEYFSRDLVEFKTPTEVFRYLKDPRL